MEGDLPLAIPLRACDFRASKAAGATDLDSQGALFHGELHRAFHRAAERNATLKLRGHIFSDELSLDIGHFDFDDINFYLLAAGQTGDLLRHFLDLGAFASDDDSRAGRMDGHSQAVPGALDDDA